MSQVSASHLLDNGEVAVCTPFATGQPRCYTVMLLIPWLETRIFLSSLSSRRCLVPFSTFCSFNELFWKDTPTNMISFRSLLLHTTSHSLLCCLLSHTSSGNQARHSHGDVMTHRWWVKPTLPFSLHVLSSFPLHTSILLCGGIVKSSMRCHILNWEVYCFLTNYGYFNNGRP